MRNTILVLTQKVDPHIEPVAQEIRQRGKQAFRFDVSDVPSQVSLSAALGPDRWQGTLKSADGDYQLDAIQSVWWRRPTPPQASSSYDLATRAFLNTENRRGFMGILYQYGAGDDGLFWVSKRDRIQMAEFKLYQLQEAQRLGLDIPATLVTTHPEAVCTFYETYKGNVIVKAIVKGAVDPQNEHQFGEERYIYTSAVIPEDLDFLEGVRVCATLFQERIEKQMDLRVVVIGHQVFTIGIHSAHPSTALDWRIDYSTLTYSIEHLPAEIERKALTLVRTLDLQFASMDFILTPEGRYVFVEVNPNGQFLWLSPPTGLPLAAAMADLLCFPQEYRI